MKNDSDPLWDPALGGDHALRRMEVLLAPFSARARGLADRAPTAPADRNRRVAAPVPRPGPYAQEGGRRAWAAPARRVLIRIAAAMLTAIVLAAAGMAYRLAWSEGRPWMVRAPVGPAPASLWIAPGERVRAGAGQVLDIAVARIGRIAVSPGSTVRLLETRAGHHRVALDSGHLRARIWAPPGQFRVSSGAAEVIDLGCDFDLWQQPDGSGRLHVRSGWIAHRVGTQEVLVPAGYGLRFHTGHADTPMHAEASVVFAAAVAALGHALGQSGAESAPALAAAVRVAEAAADSDSFTLLHLLSQHPRLADGPLYPRLAAALAAPADDPGHRAAWAAGDADAINRWWHRLPVQPKAWWRNWADAFGLRS